MQLYDTTLRDGTQAEEVSFSSADKLRIAEKLDEFGIHYIEGGWPGSNPKDREFFKLAKGLRLRHAKIAAFGSTRHAAASVEKDANITALLRSNTPVVTIFGKAWDFHATHALRVDLEQNLEMIFDSLDYLRRQVDEVIFDAEHFFDGYKRHPAYAMKTLRAARDAGVGCIVLCDTNGGTLPHEIQEIIRQVRREIDTPLGIHCHNDAEMAVANSIMAVTEGVVHVQGTINGVGERCGNANLISIIPNLKLKLGYDCVSDEHLRGLRGLSLYVSETANLTPTAHQPYVGRSAFAHKGGVHVAAVRRHADTYEHIKPELVGNRQRVLVSDLSGKSNVLYKAEEYGIDLDGNDPVVQEVLQTVKQLEHEGYQFEGAEASFELLMRRAKGERRTYFTVKSYRVIIEGHSAHAEPISEATVRLSLNGVEEYTVAEGHGPVNALDLAFRKGLEKFYPNELRDVRLIDYKVRILEGVSGTDAKIRVLIQSGDSQHTWGTVGVSQNIIEASAQALIDSFEYKLHRDAPHLGEPEQAAVGAAKRGAPGAGKPAGKSAPLAPAKSGQRRDSGKPSS
ncbi:MAG: citramalate synthase [Candidatus Tectomicrobia bacterium]|nr:citramalate synthase [Candidatus Tectomicrobia bacterium]